MKLALLQAGDQAVNAGLGLQLERILHLVEGGRNAMLAQIAVQEKKKLVLFAR